MSRRKPDAIRELAALIARDLFTNGEGRRAETLLHYDANGDYGGGWCEAAVRDRIEDRLRRSTVKFVRNAPAALRRAGGTDG